MKHPKLHPQGPPADDETVAELLSMVAPRPNLDAEQSERLKAAVRPHWQRQVQAGRFRRRAVLGGALLAAAAVLLLAVGLFLRGDRQPSPGSVVAILEKATGPVSRLVAGASPSVLVTGGVVQVGDTVETAQGRAALRLVSGLSLRLDHPSRLRFLSASAVELATGRIYVDSQLPPTGTPALEVRTAFGVVQDIGTQFEVRQGETVLSVRVREGRVRLAQGGVWQEVGAGEELQADAFGVERRSTALHGPSWVWVEELASAPDFEGKSLASLLSWVTRETGWDLRFADEALAESVPATILYGPIAGRTPERALEIALQATDLAYRLEDGTLVIESRRPVQERR